MATKSKRWEDLTAVEIYEQTDGVVGLWRQRDLDAHPEVLNRVEWLEVAPDRNGERLREGPIPHLQRLFPDRVTPKICESAPLMEPNNIAGEIVQPVAPAGIALWHVHGVDASDPAGHCHPRNLPNDKLIVRHEVLK
ncbi:MAG: hypothetical protein HY329_13820 [Chloroflexi bacterium]|nr:hypothetical protein [Chloroflexota bacterium]